MAHKPTIKDVARDANVSHATVSYILTDSPNAGRITAETKERVWASVERLGYKSNPLGRALKRGYTDSITLLIVTWNLARSHAATAMAISRTATIREMEAAVHVCDSDEEAESFLRRRLLNNIGGLLILWDSPALQGSVLNELAADGLPVVDLLPDSPAGISVVTSDREDAGYRTTKHLTDLGHRHIGMIGDMTSRAKTTTRKMVGYERALREAGIDPNDSLIENTTEFGFGGGYMSLPALMKRNPDLTAVVCINDPIALGALSAAAEMGLECPRDISIAGYGASPEGAYWRPSLTTFELSAEKVAERAIQMVVDLREHTQKGPETILVPGELIVRASTGPAPKK